MPGAILLSSWSRARERFAPDHSLLIGVIVLCLGLCSVVIPTLSRINRISWSQEQGAHGPIVLVIAIWLLGRSWSDAKPRATPGSAFFGGAALGVALLVYVAARLIGSYTIESFAMYVALLCVMYLFVGAPAMRAVWFPLAYFLFVLPPPGSLVATLTQPLRLVISDHAVNVLHVAGYPIARAGLTIYVAQYELLVQAACGGLNSIISLTAIGLLYVYIKRDADLAYCLVFLLVIVPLAVFANFVRVLILILVTVHLGDRAAQGFLHDFAGLTMFVVALGGVFAADLGISRLYRPR